MPSRLENKRLKSDLVFSWTIAGIMLGMLVIYIIVCHALGSQLQQHLPENQRMLVRTILYACAIALFPMTNLIRHIQLRLNQTMPGHEPAKNRYGVTVMTSMTLIQSIGIMGFAMFILGDDFNTLYIFIAMSALGIFLYRPKADEYHQIVEARAARK
ncbi:conserved membrane hypothetical protein [Candidatus Methylobacter favarea]|uniref:Uncharacterized protein n=1 Tax=Candidatus Methylobacter favarea TaxID=2707345 RepID=A0A8S0WIT4_9GAMM|nr:hypothetical protein [Candidatus Methylobacter favarea]CAA9890754.1 conserved membrane hypothetical protein [Candidatus Methylobacter favarea]